jgi:hypothetical protein
MLDGGSIVCWSNNDVAERLAVNDILSMIV